MKTMINIRQRRMQEKDLLAFCNELCRELGGNGGEGKKFGIEKDESGNVKNIWLFGKKLATKE
jgi:hypothetical protein